jgi:cytidylate kinase
MLLLGLSGKARSGKTFVANALAEQRGFIHLAFASALKEDCKSLFQFSEEQVNGKLKESTDIFVGKSPRQVMIEYGKALRAIQEDHWINRLRTHLLGVPQAQAHNYVISDVRFPNEANWIRRHGGFVVRLERSIEQRGFELKDLSETALDDYSFDLRIPESENTTAADLPSIVEKIISHVTNKRTA